MELGLRGKTAIVTGSNSGIGLGVAEELARAGADLVLNSFTDRPEDHALAADLAARHGVQVRYIAADMSKAADCRGLIEKAGGCDILVNNAGVQFVAPVEAFPTEKWDQILAINLSSAFHTTAAALPGAHNAQNAAAAAAACIRRPKTMCASRACCSAAANTMALGSSRLTRLPQCSRNSSAIVLTAAPTSMAHAAIGGLASTSSRSQAQTMRALSISVGKA